MAAAAAVFLHNTTVVVLKCTDYLRSTGDGTKGLTSLVHNWLRLNMCFSD